MSAALSASSGAHEVVVARDAAEHASLCAEMLGRALSEAVRERGVGRAALSGGTTPLDAYARLGALALSWDDIEWFWVDERAAPPSSPRSNYAAAARALGFEGHGRGRAHRMEGERADLDAAAAAYERLLRRSFGVARAVDFDVITLGVGEDGHTASLFPGTGAAAIDDRLVAAIGAQADKGLEARLTLTAPVILEARLIVVLARGAKKRALVEAARAPGREDEIPARILQRARGRVVWLLDEEAAG